MTDLASSSKANSSALVTDPAKPERAGYFITFEGGEGAGKSSQINRLKAWLEAQGHEVLVTREPGGSDGAEAVRHVLLSGAAEPLGTEMEAILFFAARSDNVETVIKPALAEGKVVLCDRFYDSSRVYQGMTGNVPLSLIDGLIRVACEDAIPDLTFIIDISPEEGMRRANARRDSAATPDRFEKEAIKKQKARREGFLKIADEEPERCVVINGEQLEDAVFSELLAAIRAREPDLVIASGEQE